MFSPSSPAWPTDDWLETLQFYLIVASGGRLTLDDFSDAELQAAWLEYPGTTIKDMDPAAEKLVLAFEAKAKDTEGKSFSPIGELEELPNGSVSIPMLGVPAAF